MTDMRGTQPPAGRRAGGADHGAAAVLILLLTPALFAMAGLVLDGGTALAARQRTADLAEQAARAGADALDLSALRATGTQTLDPAAAQAAACRYVALVEPADICTATVTALAGVGGPVVQQVQVTVRASSPTVLLGLIGVNRFHAAGRATAQAVSGIVIEGTR